MVINKLELLIVSNETITHYLLGVLRQCWLPDVIEHNFDDWHDTRAEVSSVVIAPLVDLGPLPDVLT